MRNSLGPSIDASARVVFDALAATVAVSSRSDRRAVFPRYAGYYAWLSRLPRRLQRSCSRGRRSLKLSTWRDGLLVMLLVLATPLAYAQFPPPPPPDAPFCGDGIRDPGPRGRARLTPCSFRLSFSFEENTSTHYL